jgi:hypothetical protein
MKDKEDYFYVAFKILNYFNDLFIKGGDVDGDRLTPKYIGVNQDFINRTVQRLEEDGMIKGIELSYAGDKIFMIYYGNTEITTKGMEYLKSNSLMKKMYKALLLAKDFIPLL